jgi:hypothetical protein
MTRAKWPLLAMLIAACDGGTLNEPIVPPVDGCPGCGPTDLAIDGYEIVWPRAEHVIYSGDSIGFRITIRNLGTMASDTTTHVSAIFTGLASRGTRIASIPAGATVTTTITVPIALVHTDSVRRNIRPVVYVSVDHDTVYTNNSLASEVLPFTPTFMRLTGPARIAVGQTYDFELSIINPSPNLLRHSLVSLCYVYYNCITPTFMRVMAPDVPAHSAVNIPLLVRVPQPFESSLRPLPIPGYVSACYGSSECAYRQSTLDP